MARRTLLVHRRSFVRKGTKIPATTFRIQDIGAPGRGPKSIEIKHPGVMTTLARRHGFISGDQRVTDIPNNKLDDFALALAKDVGGAKALRMFQAQISFRKRAKGERLADRRKFEIGKNTIERNYFPENR